MGLMATLPPGKSHCWIVCISFLLHMSSSGVARILAWHHRALSVSLTRMYYIHQRLLVSQSPPKPWYRRSFSSFPLMQASENDVPNFTREGSAKLEDAQSFRVTAPFPPAGDQPEAIQQLVQRLNQGHCYSILRGVTGSGKTLVMSHVIAETQRPTLILCHNKTLAAQLARELRSFLKYNAVELFVSYYNHYRPEFVSETTGTYMGKKSSINADLDTLRHCATRSLLTRRDVVVVASVSCIYGIGMPEEYWEASTYLELGQTWTLEELCSRFDGMLYSLPEEETGLLRDELERGFYQIEDYGRGIIRINTWPSDDKFPVQIELQQTENREDSAYNIQAIRQGSATGFNPVDSKRLFPVRHFGLGDEESMAIACQAIEEELHHRVKELRDQDKMVEADRLQARVMNDLYHLREHSFCKGIENYSRHLTGRAPGEAPTTLLDYFVRKFGEDWLLIVDESHVTLPQLQSMHAGDQARKRSLVKLGYRLPSALDHRPLNNNEFWERVICPTLFVSATPSQTELGWSDTPPVEMTIRPTFVCDPIIEVLPAKETLLQDVLQQVRSRSEQNERSLVITLTKKDAEDMASFLQLHGISTTYIHSGLSTHERSQALQSLQRGDVDCLAGVNCLREGLDLPQVSLVLILNADSEGFLRSSAGLLQIVGRAARHSHGHAIFFANRITDAMKECIDTTRRRREAQLAFNERNNCIVRSTSGSSMLSVFDILKEKIEQEQVHQCPAKETLNANARTGDLVAHAIHSNVAASTSEIETDHIPSSSGVYFWKDDEGAILYIGKATKLRSRVKSYLSASAKQCARIRNMIKKARSVDIVLTPSERDALVLESNLIKHHQPPFNVLLKDDEHYPYLCATVGDTVPSLSIVPKRHQNSSDRYRYFGPYTSFKEINQVLNQIETTYDLRAKSFLARHGSMPLKEYQELFSRVLQEVFDSHGESGALTEMRKQYEIAGMLFESEYNMCRDVVTAHKVHDTETDAIISVLQLRNGLIAGHFTYTCSVPSGLSSDSDLASALQTILVDRHYLAGEGSPNGSHTWFPDSILVSHLPLDIKAVKDTIRRSRLRVEPKRKGNISITTAATRGPRQPVDDRALQFAEQNVVLKEPSRLSKTSPLPSTMKDAPWCSNEAAAELAILLALKRPPKRIECYDVSHTQGNFPVGSRVVFLNGQPAPHLYRTFNVKTVQGVDDYASLEEILERRFRRAWVNGQNDGSGSTEDWAIPDLVVIDGGKGQLSSAIKGMEKARVVVSRMDHHLGTIQGELNVAVCALAKGEEQIFVDGRSDPVNDTSDSPAVLLLRALRDESHRFALKAHRRRRSVRRHVME